MKREIDYNTYLNKVYGAWLGKSIAGTIGAPFEGRKELFDYTYDPKAIEKMLPNDDLDLQVIWLHVLETKGIDICSDDLADAFYRLYPFSPGEYAYFKKNYARGIHPPLSGSFNNRYYINGMGCPIRSEIWACICPGNHTLAAEYAQKDGVLDHCGDSVFAEQFMAAVEAEAFFEDDLRRLFRIGENYLPENSKIYKLYEDVLHWCDTQEDWRAVRMDIIREYGHPDCTNLYQNMGFTLLSLIYGEQDFIKTTMIALNCGYDTDCVCGMAGALLGIIQGADYLIEKHNFTDTSYKLDAKVERRSDKLSDLAEDTCIIGMELSKHFNKQIIIKDMPDYHATPKARNKSEIEIDIDYCGLPVIGWNETKKVIFSVKNTGSKSFIGRLKMELPESWNHNLQDMSYEIKPHEEIRIEVDIKVDENMNILNEYNMLHVSFGGYKKSFGLNGAQVWKVFGPYWENHVDIPHTNLGEWYYGYINADTWDKKADITRQYHLNTKAAMDKDYYGEPGSMTKANRKFKTVNIKEDLFSVSDLFGFQGPCIAYMEKVLLSDKECYARIIIGHTDAYKLWINDELISESDNVDWWTGENKHHSDIHIRKGENKILLKLARRSGAAKISLIFTENSEHLFPEHIVDFGSKVIVE